MMLKVTEKLEKLSSLPREARHALPEPCLPNAVLEELFRIPRPGYDEWRASRCNFLLDCMRKDPIHAAAYAHAVIEEARHTWGASEVWEFYQTLPRSAITRTLLINCTSLLNPDNNAHKLALLRKDLESIPENQKRESNLLKLPHDVQQRLRSMTWLEEPNWQRSLLNFFRRGYEADIAERPAYAYQILDKLRYLKESQEIWELYKKLPPKELTAGFLIAALRIFKNDQQRFDELYKRAEEVIPENPTVATLRHEHLVARREFDRCVAHLTRMSAAKQADSPLITRFATIAANAGEYAAASEALKITIALPELRPTPSELYDVIAHIDQAQRGKVLARELRAIFNLGEVRPSDSAAALPQISADKRRAEKRLFELLSAAGHAAPHSRGEGLSLMAAYLALESRGQRAQALELFSLALMTPHGDSFARRAISEALGTAKADLFMGLSKICADLGLDHADVVARAQLGNLLRLRPVPVDAVSRGYSASPSGNEPALKRLLRELLSEGEIAIVMDLVARIKTDGKALYQSVISDVLAGRSYKAAPSVLDEILNLVELVGVKISAEASAAALQDSQAMRSPPLIERILAVTDLSTAMDQTVKGKIARSALIALVSAGALDAALRAFVLLRAHGAFSLRAADVSAIVEMLSKNSSTNSTGVDLASDLLRWSLQNEVAPSYQALREFGSSLALKGSAGQWASVIASLQLPKETPDLCRAVVHTFRMAARYEDGLSFVRRHFLVIPHRAKPDIADLEFRCGEYSAALGRCEEYLRTVPTSLKAIAVKLDALGHINPEAARRFAETLPKLTEGPSARRIGRALDRLKLRGARHIS